MAHATHNLPVIDEILKEETSSTAADSLTYTWSVTKWSELQGRARSPVFSCGGIDFELSLKKEAERIGIFFRPLLKQNFECLDVHYGIMLSNPTKPSMNKCLTGSYSFVIGLDVRRGWIEFMKASKDQLSTSSPNPFVSNDSIDVTLYLRVLDTSRELPPRTPTNVPISAQSVLSNAMSDSGTELINVVISLGMRFRLPKTSVRNAGEFFASLLSFAESCIDNDVMDTSDATVLGPDAEIDLSKIVKHKETEGAVLILALAHLQTVSPNDILFLEASPSQIAQALSLVDVLQVPINLFDNFLEAKLDSALKIFRLLEYLSLLSSRTRYLTVNSVSQIANLNATLPGSCFSAFPTNLRGFRCEACLDDRDKRGFCKTCGFAVFCAVCFIDSNVVKRLDSSYMCRSCSINRLFSFESVLKRCNLNWSIDVFRVFVPAIYLRDAYEREEFINVFKLKSDTGFNLKVIPKVISDCKIEIIKSLVPFIRMLVHA